MHRLLEGVQDVVCAAALKVAWTKPSHEVKKFGVCGSEQTTLARRRKLGCMTGAGDVLWLASSFRRIWHEPISYRVMGLNIESDQLRIVPCVPTHWVSFQLNYRFRETLYRIKALPTSREGDGPALTLDGAEFFGSAIPLIDDRREHAVVVRIHQTGDA